jgi:hypothetical protein
LLRTNVAIDVATRLLSLSVLMLTQEKENGDVILKLCLTIGTLALNSGSNTNPNIQRFCQLS